MWSKEEWLEFKFPAFFKREAKILFNFRPYKLNMYGKIWRITTKRIEKEYVHPNTREGKCWIKKQTNLKTKKVGKKREKWIIEKVLVGNRNKTVMTETSPNITANVNRWDLPIKRHRSPD